MRWPRRRWCSSAPRPGSARRRCSRARSTCSHRAPRWPGSPQTRTTTSAASRPASSRPWSPMTCLGGPRPMRWSPRPRMASAPRARRCPANCRMRWPRPTWRAGSSSSTTCTGSATRACSNSSTRCSSGCPRAGACCWPAEATRRWRCRAGARAARWPSFARKISPSPKTRWALCCICAEGRGAIRSFVRCWSARMAGPPASAWRSAAARAPRARPRAACATGTSSTTSPPRCSTSSNLRCARSCCGAPCCPT